MAVIEELAGIDTGTGDPFQPILAGMGGYELLPHHIQAVDAAAALLEKIPA